MAENVPVSGFNVPPAPAGANERPTAANMQPGNVPTIGQEPAPASYTQAQVQEQIAAALKAAQPQAPAASEPVPPASFDFKSDAVSDPVLSSLTNVFISVGSALDIDRAIGKALTYGDANLIDLAYIKEKGGATADQLAVLAKAIVERVQSQTSETSAAVYAQAGGKPQWDAAASVFDKSAPAHLKLVIAKMLDSGNPEAIKAASKSVVEYVQQNGLVVNPAQLVHAGAGSGAAGQAMSKAEFQAAHSKLDTNSRTYLADRDELFQRRTLGKQLNK